MKKDEQSKKVNRAKCTNKTKQTELKKRKKFNINFTIVAIILIAIFGICITPKTLQNDTFYTVKIGELIKNNGIDMMDHFSWHENLSYTYPHWLYDFCTYLIYAISGFKGIYIVTCILSALLGISVFFVNSKTTKSKPISFIITIGVMYALKPYIAARAQLVTFILFIWELYCIERFIENKKIRYAITLVIISTLIANLHVATWPFFFILFLPYIAEYIISVVSDIVIYKKTKKLVIKYKMKVAQKNNNIERIKELQIKLNELEEKNEKIKQKRKDTNKNSYKILLNKNDNVKFLIIVMVICAFTGLLTPTGDTPYTYLYKTMKGNTTENISEHQPLTLINNTEAICTLVILLSILTFTKTKIKLSDLFLVGGLCYLMFSSRRQFSMLVLIGSVVLGRLVVDMITRYSKNGLKDVDDVVKNNLVLVLLTILMGIFSYNSIKPVLDDKFVSEKSYPVSACDFILENIDLSTAKFYNEYNYGSYMLFRGIPVFIDSRADLYAPEFSGNKDEDIFSDFINTSSISKYYEDTFEKYNISHVILGKKSKTNLIINKSHDENYKEIYSDDNFVIYERLNAKK
ncbi:MAG: hypothetical protein V8S10_08815 [Clostridia bacterium]